MNIDVLTPTQMEAIDQRQIQQQSDWKSIPPDGITVSFLESELIVLPGVFPPKRDTQLLIDTLDVRDADSILDVGTGTGALAIWAAHNSQASIVAVDMSDASVGNAKKNTECYGFEDQIDVRKGDVYSSLSNNETFDVILANLPGRNKPASDDIAAAQWDTDFQAHRSLFSTANTHLRPGGRIYIVKANYPDLPEMIELATSYSYQVKVIGKSDATENDPRIYYALSISSNSHGNL